MSATLNYEVQVSYGMCSITYVRRPGHRWAIGCVILAILDIWDTCTDI